MSESSLVVRSFTEGQELARSLTKSMLVPEALRGKEADILFIVLTGGEMGMGPMKSLQAFESIKGRVGMKPVYMLGMVRAHPSILDIKLETSPTKATVTSQRKGVNEILKTVFTIDDAKAAGLTSSEMYRKWPAQMLGWRAVAIHCRANHSDIIGGHYSSEEVATFERDVTPVAEVVDAQPAVDAAKAAVKARRRVTIVETAPAAKPSPPGALVEDETTIGWGVNAGTRLADMKTGAVQALVRYAEDAATANADDDREVWVDRLTRYTAELARRGDEAVGA